MVCQRQNRPAYFRAFYEAENQIKQQAEQFQRELIRETLLILEGVYRNVYDPTTQSNTNDAALNVMKLLIPEVDRTGLVALLTLPEDYLKQVILDAIEGARQESVAFVDDLRIQHMYETDSS